MARNLLLTAAAGLLLLSGYVHGLWTGRWRDAGELNRAVERLDRVPLQVGGWQGEALELGPGQAEQARLAGYLLRRYEDRRTGRAVTALLVCGRPGPISVHTPDVCYRGAGYEQAGPTARHTLEPKDGSPGAALFTARFAKETLAGPASLRIFWCWYADGAWQAPDRPRLAFAGRPVLYKLYLIREMGKADEKVEDDPCLDFLRAFLPELEKGFSE